MIRVFALFALIGAPANAAVVHICWVGANGYTMTGRMAFPDPLLAAPLVTEPAYDDRRGCW